MPIRKRWKDGRQGPCRRQSQGHPRWKQKEEKSILFPQPSAQPPWDEHTACEGQGEYADSEDREPGK